jgi:hypothetical protein
MILQNLQCHIVKKIRKFYVASECIRASPTTFTMWSYTIKMDEENPTCTYWFKKMVLTQHNCVGYHGWYEAQ